MKNKKIRNILVIIQRSNGDVFLSSPLVDTLYASYEQPLIDLLVNENTFAIAKTLKNIHRIYTFSKSRNRITETLKTIQTIYKNYDLSISLTASDRSVFFAVISGKISISATEHSPQKSWWKKLFLNSSYSFDTSRHIVLNNTKSLELLEIGTDRVTVSPKRFPEEERSIMARLKKLGIDQFLIFHPSAQYNYKIYTQQHRNVLLSLLNTLNLPIVVTGGTSELDLKIKAELPELENVCDFIGTTSLEELFALSNLSKAYIGSDTLNMHIAASQNKRIFAIFGPTLLKTWSPWSNELQRNAVSDMPKQTYGNITVFQADMPCVACGLAGCDDSHGPSECLSNIDPHMIYSEVKQWLKTLR